MVENVLPISNDIRFFFSSTFRLIEIDTQKTQERQ